MQSIITMAVDSSPATLLSDSPSPSASQPQSQHSNLERALTMTHVPRPRPAGIRSSLDMAAAGGYGYVPPPLSADGLKRPSLGPGDDLARSTSGLGASNDSAGTERTAASSTCASKESLDRPGISVNTLAGTSERSLTIDCITCEEPSADIGAGGDHVCDGDENDTSDTCKSKKGPTSIESIMKYKTLEESLKSSYESSRRKHLPKRQLKKKKATQMKKNRHSGSALSRMGRRVGSLPNIKRALGSVVRLGSTTNVGGHDSPSPTAVGSTSARVGPRGGETNADWAIPPLHVAATAASTDARTVSSRNLAATSVLPKAEKESTGNIFLDMLKDQEDRQQQPDIGRATTPPLLGLPRPRAVTTTNASTLTQTSGASTCTGGAGLVFDPKLAGVRDVGSTSISNTQNESENGSCGSSVHSTICQMKSEVPLVLDSSIPQARPHRRGRRASYGDVSDLRKSVDFAVEELTHSKTPRRQKRLSFKNMTKTFNDSLASLLSNGSKSQVDDMEDDEGDEDGNTVLKFSTLEIREYNTQLDTNPSVSCGPAVALSWSYTVSARVTVEKYEEVRPARRRMREMRVPASEREFRLRMSGVSREEIEASIKSIQKARKKRRKTIHRIKNDTVLEKMEGVRRKLLKILGRKKSQKEEEQELWENAQCYFAATTCN